MEAAIDRVMTTYGMLNRLSVADEQATRARVTDFLVQLNISDEQQLAVQGLRYLRTEKKARRRKSSSAPSGHIG